MQLHKYTVEYMYVLTKLKKYDSVVGNELCILFCLFCQNDSYLIGTIKE